MNPVIGLDVSKGESMAQAFLDKGLPYLKVFHFKHTIEGLTRFRKYMKDLEVEAGTPPTIVLEATGHYQAPLIPVFEELGYVYLVINPLLSKTARKRKLRNVKTDAADAHLLGELFYKEELQPERKRGAQLLNLRHLTRFHESISDMYVQTKLQFHAVVDQVFPEYIGVFGDTYSKVSLRLLLRFPTSGKVLQLRKTELIEAIKELTPRARSVRWAEERAERLIAAAERNPFKNSTMSSHFVSLGILVQSLLQYQEHLSQLETQIDALAEDIAAFDLLRSIPGIGNKIAATILAEVGEIERFDNAKKLVAFAGLDPGVFSSGKFTATQNRISKRGSKRLRLALFLAVRCGLRLSVNQKIKAYYDKKRTEGKGHKVAVIASANKLLHWIFAILKNKTTFVDLP